MKCNFFGSIIVLILYSFSLYGQNNDNTSISVGVFVGANSTDIKSNSNQESNSNITGRYGVLLQVPLYHDLSLLLEPGYIKKGVRLLEGQDPMEEPEAHLRQSFLEVPVLIKYSFFEKISPYVVGGMSLGYQLNTELEVKFPGLESIVQMKEVTERFEIGAVLGGGVVFPIHSVNLFLDCRYNIGLTNMQKTGTVTADVGGIQIPVEYDKDENGYKNRVIEITFGAFIPLTR